MRYLSKLLMLCAIPEDDRMKVKWTLSEDRMSLQEGGQRRRDAAQEIAAASLVAAVEIYSSMEAAAQMVLESSSQAASDIAGHK